MTSKCIKDKKWLCYWGSHHTTFWSKFVIYKWRDARQHGIYSFYRMNFEQKRKNDKLASCRIVWLFEDLCQITNLGINIFQVKKRNVSSLLLLFFFILLVDSFSQKFLKAFTISKQIDRAIIFKTASPAWRCHAIITVVKISSSLGIFKSPITFFVSVSSFFFFFTCKQPTLNFFRGQFYSLNPKECRKHCQNCAPSWTKHRKKITKTSCACQRRTSIGSGLFKHLSRDFEQTFKQIVSLRVRTLSHINLVASRY